MNRLTSIALGIFSLGIVPLALGIYYLIFLKNKVGPLSKNLDEVATAVESIVQNVEPFIENSHESIIPLSQEQTIQSQTFSDLICNFRQSTQMAEQKQKFIFEFKKITLDPNFRNQAGDTALLLLAKQGATKESILTLAEMEADFNLLCKFGNTALHWAIANACNETALSIMQVGSDHQIDVNIQASFNSLNQPSNTCLHLAIAKGYTNRSKTGEVLTVSNFTLTEELLKRGANPNIQNLQKNTPLHLAYLRREKHVVEILLKYGADPEIVNEKGEKPIDMLKKNFEEAEALLYETVRVFLLDGQVFSATDLSVF